MDYLPAVEIEPEGEANSSVIWLHGLGADGNDFAPLVPQLSLPEGCRTRFIFPHAPRMPVTVNGGMVMRAWHDILDMSFERRTVNVDQLRASAGQVQALIDRERARGVDSRRILVAGFSQGGAVAYEAALSYGKPLAGLLVLSSYLANQEVPRDPANQTLPVLVQHGVQDPVVAEVLGQKAAEQLKVWGYPVEYERYPVEHGVCPEQIPVISRWLGQRLSG